MSQYYSRLHIKVSSPQIWKKFEDEDDASFDLAKLAETNHTSFVIDDWSSREERLTKIVKVLSETLGPDGIIIADTTNINIDPYNYCIFYLGGKVRKHEFSIYSKEEKCEMHFETSISDISGWLSYGEFRVSKEEKEQLFRCGIATAYGLFAELSANFDLPEKIYLRETSFENRPDNIEETLIGEEVYFVHAKDSYDPIRLEVMSDLGSLGYLPSNVSDAIALVLLSGRLEYMARVVELVKLSARNKHAKSPIIAISIEAEITDKVVPMKTSIPKIDRRARAEAEKNRAEEEDRRIEEEQNQREVKVSKSTEVRKRKKEETIISEEDNKCQEGEYCRQEENTKSEDERKRKEKKKSGAKEKHKLQEAECCQEEFLEAEEKHKFKQEEDRIAQEKAEAECELIDQEKFIERLAEEKRRQEYEAIKKKYTEDYAAWEKECSDIKVKRANEVSKRILEHKNSLEAVVMQKRDSAIKSANDKKTEYTKRKSNAEATLSSLGFFKFKDKKVQKANIETAIAMIEEAETEIRYTETTYDTEISRIASKISSMKEQIVQEVEKEIPFPEEPKKPVF